MKLVIYNKQNSQPVGQRNGERTLRFNREKGFSIKYDKGGIRFMNKFLSNKILDCAKVKDNASFLMEKEPITVDGTKYFKIMLSSPIIVKRSPSKKATIDKR